MNISDVSLRGDVAMATHQLGVKLNLEASGLSEEGRKLVEQVVSVLPEICSAVANSRDSHWMYLWGHAIANNRFLEELGGEQFGNVENGVRLVPEHPHDIEDALETVVRFVQLKSATRQLGNEGDRNGSSTARAR